MKTKNVISYLLVILLILGMSFFQGSLQAAEFSWRFAHEEIEHGFMDSYAREFADRLAEKSDGRIEVDIYPAMTLGSSQDMVELVQDGVLEFNFASAGHVGSIIPQAQVFLLQYLYPEGDYGLEVLKEVVTEGEAIQLINERFRDRDLEPLSHQTEGWNVWSANKPLRTPEDFDGFRMRTMTSRLLIESFEAYGADAVTTDFAEVYSGLQLGMIDGQTNPIPAIEEMGFYEVQDYLIFPSADPFILTLVTNPTFYNNLPDDIRNILDEVVEEMVDVGWQIQADLNEERIEVMLEEDPDLEIIELTEEEVEAFKELSLPVRESFIEIGGEDAEDILNFYLEDIENAMSQ